MTIWHSAVCRSIRRNCKRLVLPALLLPKNTVIGARRTLPVSFQALRSIFLAARISCQHPPKIVVSKGGDSARGRVDQCEQGAELARRVASKIVDGPGNVGTAQLPHAVLAFIASCRGEKRVEISSRWRIHTVRARAGVGGIQDVALARRIHRFGKPDCQVKAKMSLRQS